MVDENTEMEESRIDDFQASPGGRRRRGKGYNEELARESKFRDDDDDDERDLDETTDSNSSHQKQEVATEAKPTPKNNRSLQRSRNSASSITSDLTSAMKPDTPLGWMAFLSTISSALILHEVRLQKKLTCPPLVYTQRSSMMDELRSRLSHNPRSRDGLGILTRTIKPSLFVGTRSILASAAAYALHGPKEEHLKFRELLPMADGATIALDWEMPYPTYSSSLDIRLSDSQLKANVIYGPIDKPVVIILHGINNDASFGYMKSLMRSCSNQGWIACGMNFRGCGGVKLNVPRGYNAGYTGDLRTVVQVISSRLKGDTPVFLIGNSLGANVITKYLGEEGQSGTLPKCIHGGVTMGNPLEIHSDNVPWPWGHLLSAGVKKMVFQNWHAFHEMSNCLHFSSAFRKALLSGTIGQFDRAVSPFMLRTDPQYPFQTKVGYADGGEEYWHDSSSNRYIQHIPVPLLSLSSQDDFLVVNPALRSLSRCLENPNVLVVKTKCGGHLGWQEAPPEGFGVGKSWADTAMSDFIRAILDMKTMRDVHEKQNKSTLNGVSPSTNSIGVPRMNIVEDLYASQRLQSKL